MNLAGVILALVITSAVPPKCGGRVRNTQYVCHTFTFTSDETILPVPGEESCTMNLKLSVLTTTVCQSAQRCKVVR